MPLSADPTRTYTVSLKIDADKPEAERPCFVCRFMTCRETIAYRAARNAVIDERDDVKAHADLNKAIASRVIECRNFGGKPLDEILDDVLTEVEKWELAHSIDRQGTATEIDLKNSVAPHSSSGASSAKAAAPAA